MDSIESKYSSDGSYVSSQTSEQQARLREQVDQRLSCPVCLERFSDPRLLECNHTFCRKCLLDVLTKRPRGFDEEEDEKGTTCDGMYGCYIATKLLSCMRFVAATCVANAS